MRSERFADDQLRTVTAPREPHPRVTEITP